MGIKDVRKDNVIGDTNVDIVGPTEYAYDLFITGMHADPKNHNQLICDDLQKAVSKVQEIASTKDEAEENIKCLWENKPNYSLVARIMLYYIYTQNIVTEDLKEAGQQALWHPIEILHRTNFGEMLEMLDDVTAAEIAQQTIKDVGQRLTEFGNKIQTTSTTTKDVADKHKESSLTKMQEDDGLDGFQEHLNNIRQIVNEIYRKSQESYSTFSPIIWEECNRILSPPSPQITLTPRSETQTAYEKDDDESNPDIFNDVPQRSIEEAKMSQLKKQKLADRVVAMLEKKYSHQYQSQPKSPCQKG